MRTHPYLRAYMAGIVVPTILLLLMVSVFATLRFEVFPLAPPPGEPTLGTALLFEAIGRAIIFPMAIVPNLWGLWNMLYLAIGGKTKLSLGLYGALLPIADRALWPDAGARVRCVQVRAAVGDSIRRHRDGRLLPGVEARRRLPECRGRNRVSEARPSETALYLMLANPVRARIAPAMRWRGSMSSTAPRSMAARGMPKTTDVASSWAIVAAPARLISSRPSAPSSPMPVIRTPDRVRAGRLRHRAEEHVDARPVAGHERPVGRRESTYCAPLRTTSVWRLPGAISTVPGPHAVAVLAFLHLHLAELVQPLGEGGGEHLGHVLHHDEARRVERQRR